ncbi:hypothetical protein DWG24_16040 [Dickeya zeae]|uniref:Uncharacterized protein n=1 Tax=Dickeya zeae TaxID=204042 RepID=A0AAE6Z2E4_9GAMM|nr:hypothetical protein DWG24_16040 [Dickeya zeae]
MDFQVEHAFYLGSLFLLGHILKWLSGFSLCLMFSGLSSLAKTVFTSTQPTALLQAALHGLGVASLPTLLCQDDLQKRQPDTGVNVVAS